MLGSVFTGCLSFFSESNDYEGLTSQILILAVARQDTCERLLINIQ